MLTENDLSAGFVHGTENSQTKLKRGISMQNPESPDRKIVFSEKGTNFLREAVMGLDGVHLKQSEAGNLSSQDLTLCYLCESSKMGIQEKEISGKNLLSSLEKVRCKGKEVMSENPGEEDRWVERDFLQLSRGGGSKREVEDEIEERTMEKKPKLETLNLSLALPDVSLSLTPSNPVPHTDPLVRSIRNTSFQYLAPSNNNTQTTCSDDYTAASLSYSYSHPFSHNPSCSLTRNSTDYFEHSVGSHRRETDQIWYCGEGTNGSVHSRFKPVGDGVTLSNQGGFGSPLTQGIRPINKESCNSLYKTSSENLSFFPSELPARQRKDTQSYDSRGKSSEKLRGLENSDGGRPHKVTRPERILREIVSESIPVMAQILQEISDLTVESTKEFLSSLIEVPEKREEFVSLQKRLERRSDLTFETLLKCHKSQLDILVAIKTGLVNYLSGKNRLPTSELVEIFLMTRCRNVSCKNVLPVDDCDCKICSTKKGFCSACMCPVCLNFDCASNTCSWVGCDVCSHWCHAVCGIQKHLIKPGPSLKGPAGTPEMQFHCPGCGHASEMFGFVKDVFLCCAKDWGQETLIKELDCVRKIFQGGDDTKGGELQIKAEEMLFKLEKKILSPSDVCSLILKFFKGGTPDFPGSSSSPKDLATTQLSSLRGDAVSLPPPSSLPPKSKVYNLGSSAVRQDVVSQDIRHNYLKASLVSERVVEEGLRGGILSKKDGFDSLESIVRIKDAEARMFQSRADEARREAEGYRQMVRIKSEKLEEDYANKLAKLCLKETEERRRKKMEELKILESSQYDYNNMKLRMQAEIAGLLERMEATKKQWV